MSDQEQEDAFTASMLAEATRIKLLIGPAIPEGSTFPGVLVAAIDLAIHAIQRSPEEDRAGMVEMVEGAIANYRGAGMPGPEAKPAANDPRRLN